MKKPSIKSLKNKAWKLFSEFIRRKYADVNGCVTCITCGMRGHWKTMQASHFLDGRSNGILFVEENCHPCCLGCNVFRHGNKEEYYPFMLETYGQQTIDDLKRMKRTTVKLTTSWYENFIETYKKKLEELENV